MSALPVRIETGEVIPLRSLDDLAQAFHREHQLAGHAAVATVEHAILAGEALLEAKNRVPQGEWARWLEANIVTEGCGRTTIYAYMRFARHKLVLREAQPATFTGATRLLQGASDSRVKAVERDEVRRLRGEGKLYKEIAEELGMSEGKVWRYANPESYLKSKRKYRKRSHAARTALLRQERDATMRRAGGSAAEAYSLVRRALQHVEAAVEEATERDVKRHLNSAMDRLHHAEDQLVRAGRLS